ncbi:hypothetical protein [Nocardia sp. NPDC019255]|uniref:hypothetical protein n=1 Tax=Nocardia sp. NPDC019255 TaxID=3154591 RepID=UPI003407803F
MAATERRDVAALLAETRQALNVFEDHLNEFSSALDELEAETARQRSEPGRRRRWL